MLHKKKMLLTLRIKNDTYHERTRWWSRMKSAKECPALNVMIHNKEMKYILFKTNKFMKESKWRRVLVWNS